MSMNRFPRPDRFIFCVAAFVAWLKFCQEKFHAEGSWEKKLVAVVIYW
jgi:hypothetical protein